MLNLEDKTHASGIETTKGNVKIDIFYDNFVDLQTPTANTVQHTKLASPN